MSGSFPGRTDHQDPCRCRCTGAPLIRLKLTGGPGQRHRNRSRSALGYSRRPRMILADKGYDGSRCCATTIFEQNAVGQHPAPGPIARTLSVSAPYLYRERNLVERFFNINPNTSGEWSPTRYDKLAENYLPPLSSSAAIPRIWLRDYEVLHYNLYLNQRIHQRPCRKQQKLWRTRHHPDRAATRDVV